MRTLFCRVILLFSIFEAIFASQHRNNDTDVYHFDDDHFDDNNNINRDFDTDWFWMGSDLRSIGKVYIKAIIMHKLIHRISNVML